MAYKNYACQISGQYLEISDIHSHLKFEKNVFWVKNGDFQRVVEV